MSFTYSTIGAALGLAKVKVNGEIKGSIAGVPSSTPASKVLAISQARIRFPIFCDISRNNGYTEEISTRKSHHEEGIHFGCHLFYMCCGGFGYSAFGDSTPGNLLTGFGFYVPYWLIDYANACAALHL